MKPTGSKSTPPSAPQYHAVRAKVIKQKGVNMLGIIAGLAVLLPLIIVAVAIGQG